MKYAQFIAPLFMLFLALPLAAEEQSKPSMTYVNSSPEAYAAMQSLPMDQPIYMLNMIRFRDQADYPADSEFAKKNWTGQEAYAEYGRHAQPVANKLGAKTIYAGMPELTLIGPDHERWDVIFIVYYPTVKGLLGLVADPEYKKHAFHRSAAVADSRLIRMAGPLP